MTNTTAVTSLKTRNKEYRYDLDGKEYRLIIQYKNVRRLSLRPRGEEIYASAPFLLPEREVFSFVESHRDWLRKALQRQQQAEDRIWQGEGEVWLWGRKRPLTVVYGAPQLYVGEERVLFFSRRRTKEALIKEFYALAAQLLAEEVKKEESSYLHFLRSHLYLQRPEIRYHSAKSRWGSCSYKQNRIFLNAFLIHYPQECLTAVLYHELCHFFVPNHSKAFYALLLGVFPDYRQAERILKQKGNL